MKLRAIKALAVLYVVLDFLDPSNALFPGVFYGESAAAQTLPIPSVTGPWDPAAAPAVINTLIQQINNVLMPKFPAQPGAVNSITLTSTPTGQPAIIGLGVGSDPNGSIGITPNGNGNIVLFAGSTNTGLGVLQFANQAAFIKANGFTPCPGMAINRPPMLGVSSVVTGFLMTADWLGNPYAVPACGTQPSAAKAGSY